LDAAFFMALEVELPDLAQSLTLESFAESGEAALVEIDRRISLLGPCRFHEELGGILELDISLFATDAHFPFQYPGTLDTSDLTCCGLVNTAS
jgi:hypothetical protein